MANESASSVLIPKESLNVVHLFEVSLLFSACAQGIDFKKRCLDSAHTLLKGNLALSDCCAELLKNRLSS